jgi:hypothetical protein
MKLDLVPSVSLSDVFVLSELDCTVVVGLWVAERCGTWLGVYCGILMSPFCEESVWCGGKDDGFSV